MIRTRRSSRGLDPLRQLDLLRGGEQAHLPHVLQEQLQRIGREFERDRLRLFDGQLDALGVTESQLATLLADISVRKLFENSREVEASYFRKTKILPIMHVMAMQKRLVEKYPELPEKLFHLYAEAKRWAQHWRRAIPSLVEAWPNYYLADERQIFHTDPWAYGLEANRHVLGKFLAYCYDQGVTARGIAPEEIFDSSTVKLVE